MGHPAVGRPARRQRRRQRPGGCCRRPRTFVPCSRARQRTHSSRSARRWATYRGRTRDARNHTNNNRHYDGTDLGESSRRGCRRGHPRAQRDRHSRPRRNRVEFNPECKESVRGIRMSDPRVVLITGASSGVGQATARLLSQRGFTVIGTSRNLAGAEPIPTVEMLPLEVRADDSVRACVDAVFSRFGRLDVLINNAGHELAGALEELSAEEARAHFETNFFGVVRMVNAVLPFMRQHKRGHIINVSSLSGLSPIPFLGIYSASKFALEGYTEALRHEVKPFHIQVSLTEAGFLRTPMMHHRQVAANRLVDYDLWRERALTAIRASEERGPGPELVARTLLEIVSSPSPRLRHLIGRQAKWVTRLRRFLPARLYEQGVRSTFSLDKN